MSIMTIRKRIALVAATALTAGLFTVVSAPVANATDIAADDFDITSTSLLAVCSVSTDKETAYVPLTSPGIVIGEASTATDPVATDTAYFSVSGPGVISTFTAGTGGDTPAPAALSPTAIYFGDLSDDGSLDSTITIVPTGIGVIKVTYATSSTTAVLDQLTINVVAKCASDAFAAGESYYTIVTEALANDNVWTATRVDSDAATVANAGKGYVRVELNDVYGANLATAGALISTVTGPCLVGLADYDGTLSAGSGKTAVMSTQAEAAVVIVEQETANVGGTCTASTTWNGTLIGSKTFTMQGAPAKVTVSDVTIGQQNAYGYYRVTVADAAGNLLPSKVISNDDTEANNAAALASGIITAVQGNTSVETTSTAGSSYGKTTSVNATTITNNVSGAAGITRFSCAAGKSGTAKLTVRTAIDTAATGYITSDPFTVACGGALATWTISLDKATYAPGEIATLTVSGKDSLGAPVYTLQALTGVVQAFGGMTPVTTPAATDVFNSGTGIKTYQYKVDTTEGAYVGTLTLTGSTDTSAKTVQYKIASATPTVTNADVLKSIVSLIASINKQIQALQKLILRR
jgi:hypothetical protein